MQHCSQREAIRRDNQRYQSYLNTKQAAEFLNISHRTLERWRVEGKGPNYRKFGKRVTYSQSALFKWAEEQTRSSTTQEV